MKNWVKIISLENHDVCVERVYEDKDEQEAVTVSWMTELCKVVQTFGYEDDEAKADGFFNTVDAEICQQLIDNVEIMMNSIEP